MSVFVGILHGEFDDQLRIHWPFITTQAYNRTMGRWSNEHTIVVNERECDPQYVKPEIHGCIGTIMHARSWGSGDFFKNKFYLYESCMQSDYADIVRFRVIKAYYRSTK